MAIVRRGVFRALPCARRPDLRGPRHLALRRAGTVRPHAQALPHAAGRDDDRRRRGLAGGGGGGGRRPRGGLLPRRGAFDRVPGRLPPAPLRARRARGAHPLWPVRARDVSRRPARRRPGCGASDRSARATSRSPSGDASSGSPAWTWRTSGAATATPSTPRPTKGASPTWRPRIARAARCLAAADAPGFWSAVQRGRDPLRWCGASPLYTLVQAVRPSRGALLHYEQWNIDASSVVSCGAMTFTG